MTFEVGSGEELISRESESEILGKSRVTDFRERGDKETMLERRSSSGLEVAMWNKKEKDVKIVDYESEDYMMMREV